jgi:hypothetical protein
MPVPLKDNKLIKIGEEHGLEETKVQGLMQKYGDHFAEAKELVQGAMDIKVKDENDFENMDKARERRLAIRSVRIEVEKIRKSLKEQSLREGRAVDGMANIIKALVEPVEEYLMGQEKHAEEVAKAKKDKIEQERINKLSKFIESMEGYTLHPDSMSNEVFDTLLNNSEIAFNAQEKAKEEAEELRKKVEADRKKEEERVRKENEKLKIQAKKDAEEKKKLADKLKKKEEEDEKARQLKEKEEAEAQRKIEEAEAKEKEEERQKALAPDKEKILALADQVATIEMPSVKDERAMKVLLNFREAMKNAEGDLREGVNGL